MISVGDWVRSVVYEQGIRGQVLAVGKDEFGPVATVRWGLVNHPSAYTENTDLDALKKVEGP